MHGGTRLSVEHRQELLSSGHVALRILVGLRVVGGLNACIAGLAHIFSVAVGTAGSRTANHLGLAVAVEVIHQEGHRVVSRADIVSQTDAPQLRAVHLMTAQVGGRSLAVLARVALIVGQPLHNQLKLAVGINVANAYFIGTIAARKRTRCILRSRRTVYFQRGVHIVPGFRLGCLTIGRLNPIRCSGHAVGIQIVRFRRDGLGIQSDAVAIHIKAQIAVARQ